MYDPGELYFDPILTGFAIRYQDQTLYGERIMPLVPVNTQSGRYRVFDRSNWLFYPDRREPGTVANEIRGGKWSEDTFKTAEHSLQAPVHDEERQQLNSLGGLADATFGGDMQLDPEQDATNLVTRAIRLGHEYKVSQQVRNTANYPGANTVTLAGASQWNDYTGGASSTSDIVTNIQTGIRALQAATGRGPNLMIMPRFGAPYLENHPRITARFQNFTLTQPNAFATLSGFEGEILLVDSVYNSADNIDATPVISSFWGYDVWMGVVDVGAGFQRPTFAKTFAQRYPSGDVRPVDRWREEGRKSDLVRVSQKYDTKIVSSGAGYLIKNAFAASAYASTF